MFNAIQKYPSLQSERTFADCVALEIPGLHLNQLFIIVCLEIDAQKLIKVSFLILETFAIRFHENL